MTINPNIKIHDRRFINEDSFIPKTPGSAGIDLIACLDGELVIGHMDNCLIPTGFSIELPDKNYGIFILPRSGMGHKKKIIISNSPGLIDSDFRGVLHVSLFNLSGENYIVKPGDRIAQMLITPVIHMEPTFVDELSDTIRGEGGFGHSGR